MLRAVSAHQEQLGFRRKTILSLEQDGPDLPARPSSTRLAREHDVQAAGAQLISDGSGDSRLARAVDSL
jgi:hypothetical protein